MTSLLAFTLRSLLIVACPFALAACGDDAGSDGSDGAGGSSDDGGSSDASQAVVDACAKSMGKLDEAIVASGCGSNLALLVQGCERKGAKAEEAGCLAEFETENACQENLAADACTCTDGSYGCNLGCLDESFAREQCVGR